ncbi:MAG: Crp/Fnr family transcriptional regulator [Synechococcaceae cyanobacterium]|nr:Crp/Fnr family transcriptional regulator [Synechococcaceae cyanobacterium]
MVATPASAAPIDLICAQVDCDTFTLPTGSTIYERGDVAGSIYAVRRGIVELVGDDGEKICYRPGDVFCFQDIVWEQGQHRSTALARTPVDVLRLDRLRFFNMLHNHPTLALSLIRQQHQRLREQRTSGTFCY